MIATDIQVVAGDIPCLFGRLPPFCISLNKFTFIAPGFIAMDFVDEQGFCLVESLNGQGQARRLLLVGESPVLNAALDPQEQGGLFAGTGQRFHRHPVF